MEALFLHSSACEPNGTSAVDFKPMRHRSLLTAAAWPSPDRAIGDARRLDQGL
jgi:hypothetical protein